MMNKEKPKAVLGFSLAIESQLEYLLANSWDEDE